MLRSTAVASLLCPALLACARTPAPAPVVARAPDPPLMVTYRIVRSGDGEGTMLFGRTLLDGGHGARVHATAPHNAADEDLDLSTRQNIDGSLALSLHYEERGVDGSKIEWQPLVRVSRGSPVKLEVAGPGWVRTLDLTVE
jgi:hypothetical protein